ncbi:MAG: ThiF family adenylyltransferase [bacterium]|nr:ThiF family adenylyltransferase [bacterium]
MQESHNSERRDAGIIILEDLPANLDPSRPFRLLPKGVDEAYYWERVDRNLGWITRHEQQMLRDSVIGIAGCGGMGGQLAEKFLRLGVGEIRIADCEAFDTSNINRQFAATRNTVGKSKAVETARMLRGVTDDTVIEVWPQGVCEDTVDRFIAGCDVICDEIEFWAVGSRILLHQEARKRGISVFNCNTIGFGTRLFFFTPQSATMEECLNMTYEHAVELQEKVAEGKAIKVEVDEVLQSVMNGLLPEFPDYAGNEYAAFTGRLYREHKAPIIATNPSMATGFMADRILLYILRNSGIDRKVVEVPEMPGYLYFDAAKMEAKIVQERWW